MGNFLNNLNFEQFRTDLNKRDNTFQIQIPNAKEVIIKCWNQLIQTPIEWIPEYDEIAKWLTNNHGKGLFLYGANGRGKSRMIEVIIPAIFGKIYGKIFKQYQYHQINENLHEILNTKFVSIDDIGRETAFNKYGNIRIAFTEILDTAEKKGNFIIATSNLGGYELKEKYDTATIDRINQCCHKICFNGKSYRK